MFLSLRRVRKSQMVQVMTTCLVLSVVMVYWEQLDHNVVSHVKSYSYRYLTNSFNFINKSLTISRQEASRFSNFSYLLDEPDKCAGQDVLLLLFIKSTPGNRARRDAIRATWGNETFIQDKLGFTVKVVFALGAVPANQANIQTQLVKESHLHGDLIQKDFLDSFHNLTLKLLLQFHWMHDRCAHARFFMTADDDIFVHMPNLLSYLKEVSRGNLTNFWVGRVHRAAPPVRSKHSKYYVPFSMYQWTSYPDYTPGASYVVSGGVAEKIYQVSLTLNASLYIDDVFMGICAKAMDLSPQENLFFTGEGKAPNHHCIYERLITSHGHVNDIYHLWEVATKQNVVSTDMFGWMYCTAVKVFLFCRPYPTTFPCRAAFL